VSGPRARTVSRAALVWRAGEAAEREVEVVREVAVTVTLNGREVITLLASDDALDYLAVGFLRAEGFLERREQVRSVQVTAEGTTVAVEADGVDELAGRLLERRAVTSGCGKGTTFTHALDALLARPAPPGPRLAAAQALSLMERLLRGSELYRAAGGVHSAALCTPEAVLLFRDDIGRHNAIDKIQGECFLRGLPTADLVLASTGRVTSEILVKAARLGVAVVLSRSGSTDLALGLAERLGITVIGRVRGGGLTVYTGRERVLP